MTQHFAQYRVHVSIEYVFVFIFSRGIDTGNRAFDSFTINSARYDPISITVVCNR